MHNIHQSRVLPLRLGTGQQSLLSPLAFTVTLEILASTRRQEGTTKEIESPEDLSNDDCVKIDNWIRKRFKKSSACYVNSRPTNYKTFIHRVGFLEGHVEKSHIPCQSCR